MSLNTLKPSASMEIARIAAEMSKSGLPVSSLSIGDTHFPPPFNIYEKIKNISSSYSHYTVGQGIVELREEISFYNKKIYNTNEIIITPGLKQGLYYVLQALDEKKVCVLEPAWLGYKAIATMAGKNYLPINRYTEDWLDQLKSLDFDILIICSPNNPDGKILSSNEINELVQISSLKNAWIITDEIYDVYDYREVVAPNPIKKIHGLDKVIVGNGLSKSHAMTGFRLGYIMARNSALIQKINILHQNIATCAPAISQYLSFGFSDYKKCITQFSDYYKDNRDRVMELLPLSIPFKPDGGFYYFIDLERYGIKDAGKFCKLLLEKSHIAVIPGDAYGIGFNSYIRLSFSVDKLILENALPRINTFISEYDEQY